MGSPFSFGDLVRLIELLQSVHSTCIDPDNNARYKYLEFKKNVNDSKTVLIEFEEAIVHAIGHLNGPDPVAAVSRHEILMQQANSLVGAFIMTLKGCQEFLGTHIKYGSQKGSFFDNAFWHGQVQAKVDEFRQRIREHTDKMSLLVDSVSLRLATETAAKTQDIHDRIVGSVERTERPNIPSGFEGKFQDSLARNPAIRISHPSKIPMKEGVDIMLLHFQKSTTVCFEDYTDEQYLHLLKAHWLAETLLKSDAFKRIQPGHLYHRTVERVRQSIAELYQREDIRKYIEQPHELDSPNFDIWPRKDVIPEKALTEPIGREDMLARLPVVSQSPDEERELFVFRKDERRLRVVYLRSPTDTTKRIRETETFFDLTADRMVPLYAIATGPRTEWSVQLFYSSGATQVDYPLQTREHAFELQKAFIEYETAAYSENVSCTATYKKKGWAIRDGQHVSRGEIQLLKWPLPKVPRSPPISPPISPRPNGTISSTPSSSNFSRAVRTFADANPNLTSISEAENDKTVVVTALPPSPVIIAFTQYKENGTYYTFWQISLDHVEMETSRLGDRHLGFRAKKNGESFSARRLTVKEDDLMDWDICAFFLGQKVSSKVKDKKSKDRGGKQRAEVKTVECMHFALDFKNADMRAAFEHELWSVRIARQKQLNDAKRTFAIAHMEAQHPTVELYPRAPNFRRDSAFSNNSANTSRVSINPELPPIRRVPTISESIFAKDMG
ncbi:hypothetical protein K432DRAFT_409221 [Lepidopterella palustris CBS 459.81]|uniref:Uncharacterized protein n=1 Tax=Lepidopterella palustris CBS 459.81 TaxID=1314670 RepID=A0A8E2E120_9PEZI|nr:hypothetical protein K432DRAFT_409221 [Lepidopterella palustris CBS 459.81]